MVGNTPAQPEARRLSHLLPTPAPASLTEHNEPPIQSAVTGPSFASLPRPVGPIANDSADLYVCDSDGQFIWDPVAWNYGTSFMDAPQHVIDPREGEAQGSRFADIGIPTQLPHPFQFSLTSSSTHETAVPIQETCQPSDVEQNFPIFYPRREPFSIAPYSIPATDTAGPSGITSAPLSNDDGPLAGPSKRRQGSPDVATPPAKRARRISQPNTPEMPEAPESIEAQVDPKDESRGFLDTDLPLDVQKAMRDLVTNIRLSVFFTIATFEPNIGTHDANALMLVASPELWNDYGTKEKSIYSLFIKTDGNECKCLWCGDIQLGKLQRAIGHFRAKHLGHKPFACDLVHTVEKVW